MIDLRRQVAVSAGPGGLVLVLALGCSVDANSTPAFESHCGQAAGDQTCVALGEGRPYCSECIPASNHRGCVASLPGPACRPGGGNGSTTGGSVETSTGSTAAAASTTAGEAAASSSTAGESTTGGGTTGEGTMGEGTPCEREGRVDPACESEDPSQPYCAQGLCRGCMAAGADEFCSSLDGLKPWCDPATDLCQSCASAGPEFCGGQAPICDVTGACVPCTSHAQCPQSACHLDPSDPLHGACFGADEVRWIDAAAICPGQGTEASPSCSLAQAIRSIADGGARVLRVVGGRDYPENLELGAATVAILGQGGVPQLTGTGGVRQPTLRITGGTAYLQRIRVGDNGQVHGITCEGGILWLDDAEVRDNAGYGIHLNAPCDVTLRRTGVHGNLGGGVRQFGGTLRLDNAVVARNGNGARGPGILLQFADLQGVYATVAGNEGVGADSLQCLEATGQLRNSIVSGMTDRSVDLDCFVLDFDHNVIDTPSFVGADGVAVGPYDAGWFANPTEGDFRLLDPMSTVFGGVALWQAGDPEFDADGTPRPMGGALGYVGVDEP